MLWRAAGLAVGVVAIRILGATGVLPDAHSPPFAGTGGGVSLWQAVFPLAVGGLAGTLAARRVPADPDGAGAGRYLGAHTTLFAGAALAFAGNAYLLVFVIPALHVWLLLPVTARLGAVARAAAVVAGWLGPAAVIALLAGAGGLRQRRSRVVRAADRRRRHPARVEPGAGDPGLRDDRAPVARPGGAGWHPYGGWRIPAPGIGWLQP